jgi:DNA repair exonuclease SbcCD ATPase subunit
LRQLIESAPYESLQSAQAAHSAAQSELDRSALRAGAAERLWKTLSKARRKVVERLTQPVISRVEPYIREIFPGCTLDADEEFRINGLKSPQYPEPFDELSGGAREQLALITRIGFAEVLAGDGRLPLLLDDALVNTDPARIRIIHRVLDRASAKLQIIVFTCHDILFDALGAEATFALPARRSSESFGEIA